nr:hypothetical protein [uncultured Psychroserpens sp.]
MRTFARIGHFHNNTLLKISIDSFLKFETLKIESDLLINNGHFEHDRFTIDNEQEKIQDLEFLLLKESIKVVVFLGAFLESYFFELSAIIFGQKHTKTILINLIYRVN